MNIQHLPNETLTKIAGYLTFPSQAIVAVALTAPSGRFRAIADESQLREASRAIVTSAVAGSCDDWDTVDFGEVEPSLAARLSDDDVESVFVCLLRCELGHRVRSVFLAGCTGVRGECIRPLRHFGNLLQVDLRLVGRKSGAYETGVCSLEEDSVIGTLNRHVRTWGCLKHVLLPEKFLLEPSNATQQFLLQLSESVERCGGVCSNCDQALVFQENGRRAIDCASDPRWNGSSNWPLYGRSLTCCGSCLKDYCQHLGCRMDFCQNCRTMSCRECGAFDVCYICLSAICNDCREVNNAECGIDGWNRCHDCNQSACEDCLESCPSCDRTWCLECSPILHCERCNKTASCDDCGSGEELGITWCEDGDHCLCRECRMSVCIEEGEDSCDACMALVGRDAIAAMAVYKTENECLMLEIARLSERVQEQEEEIRRLKGEDSDETISRIEEAMGELEIER